ncbi:hypothetical protein ACHAXR_007187, partial [Thalassiosira sp. AJA248-18]
MANQNSAPPSASPKNDDDPSQTLTNLQSELSTLNRVSHRLAMTDAGPSLEKVLALLLPRLLQRIGKNDDAKKKNRRSNNKRKMPPSITTNIATGGGGDDVIINQQIDGMHDTIHKKLIEMLGHTMKRVREDRDCKLPCVAILELLIVPPEEEKNNSNTANPFTINLGLAFLTLGINRCTPGECASLLPGLLKFMGCNFNHNDPNNNNDNDDANSIGIGHLLDPSRKIRHDQTWHLILRSLESISHNPTENAASRRRAAAQKSASSVSTTSSSPGKTSDPNNTVASLHDTKHLIASNPILAAALFDLFMDVFLYSPVPASSSLIPNGLSTVGYQRLIGGAASQKTSSSGCKNWKEEFVTRASLRQLKLKFLDLIAPCRRYALFLPEKLNNSVVDGGGSGEDEAASDDGMGISRTVALMVLLTGDTDPDVKSKAESYLRAHMDTYRGKDVPQTGNSTTTTTVHDALLGNSIALAQTMLVLAIGGAASLGIDKKLTSQYKNEMALGIMKTSLGLTYCADSNNATQQKAVLSCSRMKISESSAAPALKFVGKMFDDNPKLFHVGMDMEEGESDIAAVSIGTLVLAVFGDLHRPGSSASLAMESASSVLNSLCIRLSLFYDARVQSGVNVSESMERIRQLLAQSMAQACAVLAPTSSGESTYLANNGTKSSTVQIDQRDKCYGVICTLARSQFALDDRYALFDCGKSNERPGSRPTSAPFPLTTISTATSLFGCASNEVEMLRPRATSALDALLGAYVRVVKFLAEREQIIKMEQISAATPEAVNPWANVSESATVVKEETADVSTEGLSRSLLPLLWNASRRNLPKSSRIAAARWSSELLLCLSNSNAYHLLCFLSGDDDATVSMISKQALEVDKMLGEDNILTQLSPSEIDNTVAVRNRATFSVLMDTIVKSQSSMKKRPKYSDFHVRAQAATLRFLLHSLFSEESFYGDEDGGMALKDFVLTILKTLAFHKGCSLNREETDLIDECSIALASCTSSSKEARLVIVNHEGAASDPRYGYNDIAMQALTSNSSKTRRHLAEVMSHLYEDNLLWDVDSSTEPLSISTWIERSGLSHIAVICREKLHTMSSSFVLGEVHGAAFLGSSCVRAFRLAVAEKTIDEENSNISNCWEQCCGIIALLGKGLAHSDIAIGNACSKAIVIAFSYDGPDAPILNRRLFDAVAIAMDSLNSALKKFSSIDHADPTRVSSLIQAAGLLLAASTSGAGFTKGAASSEDGSSSIDLGPARLQCTEALFGILGSTVYRKDDELSLVVGEALLKYADAFGAGEWSSGSESGWKEGKYDEKYAFELPPHRHVLYTMFQRELLSSNPLKRNACASTFLALIGHASRCANLDPSSVHRAFVQEIWKNLALFQSSFIKLLADPKSKHLSRESCCKGLAACRGLAAAISSSIKVGDESLSQIESLNEQLLKAFGQTTNYGGSIMQETDAQARERREETE